MKLEKVYIDKVWADEIFYASETIEDVVITAPAGVTFSASSQIIGDNATVAVVSCELSESYGQVTAHVEFIVQEDFTVQIGSAPHPDIDFKLEYEFRFDSDFTYQKLTLPDDVDIENLHCKVFRFQGAVELQNVSLPEGQSVGSFDNFVTTMTKLKALEAIQTFVALGAAPYVKTAPITIAP
ncbi:hypothetical protein ACS3UN_12485 [Oscillospiraceae bacterium LTW-04]|nr:hypothetical protein RBH76_00290 [Oscillospiraceae bacterium MB24-C1]